MERRHLTYFLAVVDAGSISEAARRLHLSQPSISQAIKELEREMRQPLFDRGRTLVLTPSGRALVAPARRTLRSFESLRSSVEEVRKLTTGLLEIAAASLIAVDPLVSLVSEFRRRYPGVRVRITEASTDVGSVDALRRGEADLVFHPVAAARAGFRSHQLRVAPSMAAFPPGTENLPDEVGLEHLVGRILVTGTLHTDITSWMAGQLAQLQLPPVAGVLQTSHRESMIPFVLRGNGMAVLTHEEAQMADAMGAVVRPLTFTVPRTCFMIHHDEPLSPAAAAFADMARELLGSD